MGKKSKIIFAQMIYLRGNIFRFFDPELSPEISSKNG